MASADHAKQNIVNNPEGNIEPRLRELETITELLRPPYEQSGHIYMQCSKAKGPCSQPHTSEAELLPQVNQLLDNLQKVESIIDQVIDALKAEHDNVQEYYVTAVQQTRKEHDRLEKRLSLLYEDRLDGRIAVDEYDKIVSKTKAEMEKLD